MSFFAWFGNVPANTVSVMIPFGYTLSPKKLTKGEWNGQSVSLSIFICWNADNYIMSAELPLSIKTRRILKFSIFNMITKGSLCGCFAPHESFVKKVTSSSSDLACFVQIDSMCIFSHACGGLLSSSWGQLPPSSFQDLQCWSLRHTNPFSFPCWIKLSI